MKRNTIRIILVGLVLAMCGYVAKADESNTAPVHFLIGGDLSMATYMEDWGTKFCYADGTSDDVFDILQAYGVNLARLRMYNKPGTPITKGSAIYRTPLITAQYWSGNGTLYAGPEDILHLAQRAKAHNMAICLSIYLSDFWTGAAEQYIPSDWANATTTQALGDSVYNYVYRYMSRMVAQGTAPEYVSVGNETNYGILYNTTDGTRVSYGGHTDNIANTVLLFNKAYDAIKAASPTSQVIIHHSYGDAGKIAICRAFFKNLKNNGCRFDIVGGSYYPHWATEHGAADATPTGMLAWAADMKQQIQKPVMIMEVGYSWDPYKCPGRNGGNWPGQLGLNGAYNEASEGGQKAFIHALHEAIKTDSNIVGYMYWDPIFVDQLHSGATWWNNICWAEKYSGSGTTWWNDGNVISNTTLFDYQGMPLKALYEEMASLKPVTPTASPLAPDAPTQQVSKILDGTHLYLLCDGKRYTIDGRLVP